MRRLQNKIAESRYTLPATLLYGTAVWLLAGLIQHEWWVQFGCYMTAILLMMEMNARNLLIRIYSRSVSVTFILLFCAATFLFPSWRGAAVEVCIIIALMLLFSTYRTEKAEGRTYYLFLVLGLGSIADVWLLCYVPLFWLFMLSTIYSFSWRTFAASLLGLLTPYWFLGGWILYQDGSDYAPFVSHFAHLSEFSFPPDFSVLPLDHVLFFALVLVLWFTGSVHFLLDSYQDKVRVRQLYYSFMVLCLFSFLFLMLQPQQESLVARVLIISVSPLFGHFVALTSSKFSNIAVIIAVASIVALTAFSLWSSSLHF